MAPNFGIPIAREGRGEVDMINLRRAAYRSLADLLVMFDLRLASGPAIAIEPRFKRRGPETRPSVYWSNSWACNRSALLPIFSPKDSGSQCFCTAGA
jgi:hypothetical protein